MTVFYRGPRALITNRTFEARSPQRRVFAIRELSYAHVVVDSSPRVRPVAMASSGLGGLAAVAMTTRWFSVPTPLVGLLLAAVLLVTAGACLRVRADDYELRAVYRGQMVSLFRSTSAREFGQVRRALVRAIENVTDG